MDRSASPDFGANDDAPEAGASVNYIALLVVVFITFIGLYIKMIDELCLARRT